MSVKTSEIEKWTDVDGIRSTAVPLRRVRPSSSHQSIGAGEI